MTTTPTNPEDKTPRECGRQTCRAAYMAVINIHHAVELCDLAKTDPHGAAVLAQQIGTAAASLAHLDGLCGDIVGEGEPSRREMGLAVQLDDISAAVRRALNAAPNDTRPPLALVADLIAAAEEAGAEIEARDMAATQMFAAGIRHTIDRAADAGSQPASAMTDLARGLVAMAEEAMPPGYSIACTNETPIRWSWSAQEAAGIDKGTLGEAVRRAWEHSIAAESTCRSILREALQAPRDDKRRADELARDLVARIGHQPGRQLMTAMAAMVAAGIERHEARRAPAGPVMIDAENVFDVAYDRLSKSAQAAMDTKADDARKIRGLGDALTRLGWDRVQDPGHFAQALLDALRYAGTKEPAQPRPVPAPDLAELRAFRQWCADKVNGGVIAATSEHLRGHVDVWIKKQIDAALRNADAAALEERARIVKAIRERSKPTEKDYPVERHIAELIERGLI